jgi:hypothetical protein
MNWMRKCFFAFCVVLLLAGCVDVEVKTTIRPDGSGKQSWQFTSTALLATRVREQIERNPFFKRTKAKITDEFKEGDYILHADLEFSEITDLEDNFRSINFEKKGIFHTTYVYTETWKHSFDQGGLIPQQAQGLVPITLKLSVELPGKIVDSNAETVEGSTAQWSMPITDLVQSKTFRVVSQRWNLFVLLPVLFLGLAGLAGLGFFVLTALHKPRSVAVTSASAAAQCPSCQSTVPAGSLFCNVCGTRLK